MQLLLQACNERLNALYTLFGEQTPTRFNETWIIFRIGELQYILARLPVTHHLNAVLLVG